MATMYVQGKLLTVVYVDPGAGGANDGTTPTNARTTLPAIASLAANSVYLCRRGTSNIAMATGTLANSNVYIIGMPDSGTIFYSEVPAEAKSAWDADSAGFANLSVAGNTFTFNQNFGGFANVEIHQTGNATNYNVIDSSSNSIHSHFIINCRLTDPSYDLSVNTSPSTLNTGGVRLLGDNTIIRDLYIERRTKNASQTWSTTNKFAVDTEGQNISLSNIEVWYQYDASVSSNYSSGVRVSNGVNVDILNVDVNLVGNGTSRASSDSAFYIQADNLKIRNITAIVDRLNGSEPTLWTNLNDFVEIIAPTIAGIDIDGITIDLSLLDWSMAFLNIDTNVYTSVKMMDNMFRNITITAPTGSLESSTIENKITITAEPFSMEDCVLDAGIGNVVINGANNSTISGRCKNVSVVGSLDISGCPFAEITSLTRTGTIPSNISSFPPLVVRSAPGLQVKSLTLPGTWDAENVVTLQTSSWVFIDSLSSELIFSHPGASYKQTSLYVNNVGGTPGRWEGHNYSFDGITSAAFRSGGANAAIRLSGQRSDPDNPLFIGFRPFPGIKVSPQSTGLKTLTIYAAFKSYATPEDIRQYLIVQAESPIGASGFGSFNSLSTGNWKDDNTSIWNNDSGLTQKKCEMQVQVDRLEDIELRIAFSWYTLNAYLYLDPIITIS